MQRAGPLEPDLLNDMGYNRYAFPALAVLAGVIITASVIGIGYKRLTHRDAYAEVRLDSAPLRSSAEQIHHGLSFRVAVASMLTPMESISVYQDLSDLLARGFGLPLVMLTRKSYSEINGLIRSGEVDLAFVCSGGFASAPGAMDVIAAPVIAGEAAYHSYIIVPSDSPAGSIEDLAGGRFAFTQPESNTGCWYPVKRIERMGKDPASFFSQVQWTGSHDRSVLAVAHRLADGAAVSSIIFHYMLEKDPALLKSVRIIEWSPSFPSPPVVVRKSMPAAQRELIFEILLNLDRTEEGKEILSAMGIDGFTGAANDDYASLTPPKGDYGARR